MNKTCDLKWIHEHIDKLSDHCKQLLLWMLSADPGDRPTAKQALLSEWFKQDEDIIMHLLEANDILCRNPLHIQALNLIAEMPSLVRRGEGDQQSMGSFQQITCYFNIDPQQYENKGGSESSKRLASLPSMKPGAIITGRNFSGAY